MDILATEIFTVQQQCPKVIEFVFISFHGAFLTDQEALKHHEFGHGKKALALPHMPEYAQIYDHICLDLWQIEIAGMAMPQPSIYIKNLFLN